MEDKFNILFSMGNVKPTKKKKKQKQKTKEKGKGKGKGG